MREQANRTHPIREDMLFQQRSWVVERIAWIVLGLLVCVALSGIFSSGPLSTRTATAPDNSVTVQYERFQHNTRIARFTLTLAATGEQASTLRLSPSFQDAYEISGLQPAPQRSSAGPNGLELAFATPRGGDSVIVIWAQPRRPGFISLSARAGDKPAADFSVLIYP